MFFAYCPMVRGCKWGVFSAILALGASSLLVDQSHSQPDQKPPFTIPPAEFECRWADSPIKIDGKADEPAWKQAQVIDQFYLPWLKDKARPAKTATRARLLWDREYLYFFAEMEDSDLYADVKEHDGMTWDNDVFELFFKPADDKPGYYEFQVNAAGTIMDMFIPRRGSGGYKRFIKDGDFHLQAKVQLQGTLNNWADKDKGWSVEGKIPWKDFLKTGGRPQLGEKWQFALCRYDYSVDFEGPELSTCAPLKSRPFADFHHHEDYATLRFVGPDAKKSARPYGIDKRIPVTTARVVGAPEPPPPFRVQRVYPNLKADFPIAATRQPGTDLLLMILLDSPWGMSRIVRVKDEPNVSTMETLLTLPLDTANELIFHPRFQDNGYVFLSGNGPKSGPGSPKATWVKRYVMERQPPYRLDPKSAVLIIDWPSDGHNGGGLAFGHDGLFYVTSGDGTSDSDTNVVGQDMTKLVAKVLRIDVDNPPHPALSPQGSGQGETGKRYSVPKDNPFLQLKDARPEIWALGLRNPWKLAVDQKTGQLWIGTNGQDLWEQVYLLKKGANYSWSVLEGSHPFYFKRKRGPLPFVMPAAEHHHSESRSLTGGLVYYGSKLPELQGAYLYGDYSTGKIWALKHDAAKVVWHKEIADSRLTVTGFGFDKDGEVLVADFRGQGKGGWYRLQRQPKEVLTAKSTFPRKLSDTGLFGSVKGHVMAPGLLPYSVNAPVWHDKAFMERWLALPGLEKIDFTTWRGWNFPEGTVAVQSLALEMEEGNPASRRWIETRLLTKQGEDWFGYSYVWNDEQTEGYLVDATGLERDFFVKVARAPEYPSGVRKQTWRYPARTECLICHSRAANWVLGLTEVQMNRDHHYGGVIDHQLRVLEHLGMLRVNWAAETHNLLREEAKAKGMKDKEIDAYLRQQSATRNQRAAQQSPLLTVAPDKYRKLVDPYDPKQDLTLRARSYLHANCSHCHVEAGGGNAQMELEFTTAADKTKIFDVRPQHDTFGMGEARLIAPGFPERSLILFRMSHRSKGFMPPVATSIADEEGARLLQAWIKAMPVKGK